LLIGRTTIGTRVDPSFEHNRSRGTFRGWVPGGYHFLYPGIDAHAQWFCVGRQLDGATLPNVAGVCDAITRKNKQSFNETVSVPLGSNPQPNPMRGPFFSFPLFSRR
jgi:GH25 family lysozyme M1 (1,4-beta-N-acetylmuramidase)